MPDSTPQRRKTDKRGKSAANRRIFAPALLIAGVVLLWAALNEPAPFNGANLVVWLLSALVVGLLARAALALVEPVISVFATLIRQGASHPGREADEP
jgi:hypothetical protein